MENIKSSTTTDRYTAMSRSTTPVPFSITIGKPPLIAIGNHQCNTPSVSLHVDHEHCIDISIIMLIHKHTSRSHVILCVPCMIKLLVWLELSDFSR